jgi:hypothetical protein
MSARRSPETIAEIVALRGQLSASEIGEKFNLTRDAVIAIWFRAKCAPISKEALFVIRSRTNSEAQLRRREE